MFAQTMSSAMDWTLAIEKNTEALRRILAMLVAMVASADGGSAGGQFTFFPQVDAPSQNPALAEKSKLSPALPRHLHRFVLRLLRPAEAAARRLIIIAARGLVVELAPQRIRKTKPKPLLNRKNGFGTNVVIRPGPLPEWARALAPKRSSTLSLPLLDPLKHFGIRRGHLKQANMPRISLLGDRPFNPLFARPHLPDPVPQPSSPDDPLDASRLHRRLEAMALALNDLPRQAKRLARWQARLDTRLAREGGDAGQSDINLPPPLTPPHRGEGDLPRVVSPPGVDCWRQAGRLRNPPPPCGEGLGVGVSARSHSFQRLSPMRPGRPPGWRRRPDHAVYEVLNELHGLAVWARERPDSP
jgi:hypothetical protein